MIILISPRPLTVVVDIEPEESSMTQPGNEYLHNTAVNDGESTLNSSDTTADQDGDITVKIVHTHSNYSPHPDDLGFFHDMAPAKKANQLWEAYDRGFVRLDRYYSKNTVKCALLF